MVRHHHSKNISSFRNRKNKFLSIALYVILLLALSVFIFMIYSKDALDDGDQTTPLFRIEKPKSEKLLDDQLWEVPSTHGLRPCVKPTGNYKVMPIWDRYLTVRCNGGLNQMRTGIADMVAVARIMNATLVIPQLDKRSFWQDTSTFANIFDEIHFIESLQQDVRIVRELPKELESLPRARKHFSLWSGVSYYEELTELWKEYQVIHVAKSDSRLANNDLPLDIQRLRCRALYHALRFSPSIDILGKKLVERLRSRAGRYIALHLRYEKDMLSFTGCTFGLTDAESEELKIMRQKTSHWKIKSINSTEQRTGGLCPLTPKEVGIFLQALGYQPSTLIYIAAGEIYGGNTHISELTSRFPNTVFKEMLASKEELRMFSSHASQTAALDYIISIESDVFIPSHSGNMARVVEGHRRFLGHRKTITPGRKNLVDLFDKLEAGRLEVSSLSRLVKRSHINRFGEPRRRGGPPPGIRGRARWRLEESFYQNPYPECICKSESVPRTGAGLLPFAIARFDSVSLPPPPHISASALSCPIFPFCSFHISSFCFFSSCFLVLILTFLFI